MAIKKHKTKLVAEKKLFRKKRKVVSAKPKKRVRRKNPAPKKTIMGTPKMKFRIYQIANGVDTFACGCDKKETARQIAAVLNQHAAGSAHFIVIDYD